MTFLAWYIALVFGLALWYPCCGPSAVCRYCSGDVPASRSVTLAGFTNDNCDNCADLNSTFVLPWKSDTPGECDWQYNGTSDCNGDEYAVMIELSLLAPLPTTRFWKVTVEYGVGETYYNIVIYQTPGSVGPTTVSCTSALTPTYASIGSVDGGACDGQTTSTCSVAAS